MLSPSDSEADEAVSESDASKAAAAENLYHDFETEVRLALAQREREWRRLSRSERRARAEQLAR